MRHRVRHVLLVSSLYDCFILVEDGQVSEAIHQEFREFNIIEYPDITRVSTGSDALELLERHHFDLVITTLQLHDMGAAEFAERVREAGHETPILLLAFENRRLTDFLAVHRDSQIDRVFLWQGDVRILVAMVKSVEDRLNLDHDTGTLGVPLILVVEDNIRFYSSFLPAIYAELLQHTQGLIAEGLNPSQKQLRSRARPKVVLCQTYEEAQEIFDRYESHVLGIISDIEFPRNGVMHKQAGSDLAAHAREHRFDIPIVLQSSIPQNAELARERDALFLLKGSPVLLDQLRSYLLEHFGFGEFVFRLPDGSEVGRAHDLRSLVDQLAVVPQESLIYHGERNHFSFWLKARAEFTLAANLRPQRVAEFADSEAVRQRLITAIADYRSTRDRSVVADFSSERQDDSSLMRIGSGSLGGKARGLAFINRLLYVSNVGAEFPDMRIVVPRAVVLATDVFDEFLKRNGLRRFALECEDNEETLKRILGAPFSKGVENDLRAFLEQTTVPLAVRSSGLLEDSPNQPFAGIYRTYMLPNNDPSIEVRLVQLISAIKHVYASTFSNQARAFLKMTPYRLEEEHMAVIVQRLVGRDHGGRFYPVLSGVGRSHNFYPHPPLTQEDGIVAVALGLGRTVVEGGNCLRFSPRHPSHIVDFGSVDGMLRNSQRQFFGLDLTQPPGAGGDEGAELTSYDLTVAEEDGTLAAVGSTYSPDNDRIYDGIHRPGIRLVSMAPMLRHGLFPLAESLDRLLEIGSRGIGAPVEIEFAVDLPDDKDDRPELGFLQLRPLAVARESEALEIGDPPREKTLCHSCAVLGNGRVDNLRDLVIVEPRSFDRTRSVEVADEIGRFNAWLLRENRPYLLIGVGRWGSADPHLGIPVAWNQIAGARVIVEAGFEDLSVEPSQGSHFFQNLTSCNVGYFTVNPQAGAGFVDWEWLASLPTADEAPFARRVELEQPVTVMMNGHKGEGLILKPEAEG
ncbi:hypothetical protein ABI59_04415 [Acidobacteria bacterium Mor1]|nr:hypothetical protein ABI59_04415 [Acidobacteria bacterium Mor1]